jgi:hypothetical protein
MARMFRYSRSIVIDAPVEAIMPEIADLRRHSPWSPSSLSKASFQPSTWLSWCATSSEGAVYAENITRGHVV